MKRLGLTLACLVPAAVVAWAVWGRAPAKVDPLTDARAGIGTKSAGPKLSALRREQPTNAEVHFLSARQARLEGRTADAETHLERAGQLGWPPERSGRERVLIDAAADYARGRPALARLRRERPADAELLVASAAGELRAGRAKAALDLADEALRHSHADPQARRLRGAAHLELRRLDLAKADLEAAVAAGPDSLAFAPARLSLAACLLDQGEFARAIELFRAARDDAPDDPLAHFGVGRAASYLSHLDEADAAFRAVLGRRPGHVETLLALAQVAEQRGDLAGALGHLEQAAAAEPDRLATHARLAKLLAAVGQPERAAKHEARYRELDPTRRPHKSEAP